jgi:lincosamide nucleotidyltransferase A/C/D/E
MMTAEDVVSLLDGFEARGVAYWIAGGWGVDALLGVQTREHDDLDIAIPFDHEHAVLAALAASGFSVETDWRPVRVALKHPDGREVDVHPIRFQTDGSAWLPGLDGGRFEYPADCFAMGSIAGRGVPCVSAEQQLVFHQGYELADKDRADLRQLAEAGLISATGEARL